MKEADKEIIAKVKAMGRLVDAGKGRTEDSAGVTCSFSCLMPLLSISAPRSCCAPVRGHKMLPGYGRVMFQFSHAYRRDQERQDIQEKTSKGSCILMSVQPFLSNNCSLN